jgi:hypothetical protein
MTTLFILLCVTTFAGPFAAYCIGRERGRGEGHRLGAAIGFVRGRRSEREEARNL